MQPAAAITVALMASLRNTASQRPKPELDMELDHTIESLLKQDRLIVFGGLVIVTVLAWVYLFYLNLQMEMGGDMPGKVNSISEILKLKPWTPVDAALMFIMWNIMMIGMMLPSATPMILLYARVIRKQAKDKEPLTHTSAFFGGYIAVWTAFSAAATILQWGLERAALLSQMMVSVSPVFGGIVLIIAGSYQWLPYKRACLEHCRSPIWYLSAHWRSGIQGAFIMGLEHGVYCLGCCWAIMMLLFVGGVMNLLCVAAITIFVLVEKVSPYGRSIGHISSVILILLGLGMMLVL